MVCKNHPEYNRDCVFVSGKCVFCDVRKDSF